MADGKRPPFLLALHGLGGAGAQIAAELGLEELAARVRLVYAAPDGSMDRWGRRFWNAGSVCCNFAGAEIDDVKRLGAIIDYARDELHVDPARVFVVGYSNGGFMAHRLACDRSKQIQAIVSFAAAGPTESWCKPERGVTVLEIHGDRDEVVPFKGGHLFGNLSLPMVPSVRDGLSFWARVSDCEAKLLAETRLDLVAALPGPETQTFRFRGCRDATLALWQVHGGGHVLRLRAEAWQSIWQFLDRS